MRVPRATIALRLALVGGLQVIALVLVASLSVPIWHYFQDRESPHGIARAVTKALENRAQLPEALQELRKDHHFDLSLYDASGALVASNVSPALPLRAERLMMFSPPPGDHNGPDARPGPRPPPPPNAFEALSPSWLGDGGPPHEPPLMLIRLNSSGSDYSLTLRLPKRSRSFAPLLVTLAVGALVVSLGAVLTARFITLPLERLSKVVGAFGAGNLTSRSDIVRQDEVGVLATTFNKMADRIQSQRETERELLNNVAHELRTPLARIGVALEIAEESDGNGAQAALLGIREDLSELEGLLEDVLTASRLQSASDAAHWVLRLQPQSLSRVVSAVRARFASHHPERSFHVEAPKTDETIVADEVLLRRAVSNLLENAHKYSPDPTTAIWLRVTATSNQYTFEVEDHGMGIAASDQEKVFLPFFRSEQSRSKSTGGVGLGLTLAKRIALAHGGTLELQSQPGKGTVVRLTAPLCAPNAPIPSQQIDTHA